MLWSVSLKNGKDRKVKNRLGGATKMKTNNDVTHVVIQGEYMVSGDPNCMLSTVLGSCVATCLYDPVAGIGGMNHFLLPGVNNAVNNGANNGAGRAAAESHNSYGLHLMECLINGLLRQGAKRSRLQGKLFGGAYITKGLPDIGRGNVDFARKFLAYEGIPCTGESLGGSSARRLRFWPVTGQASQRFVCEPNISEIEQKMANTQAKLMKTTSCLELF